MCKKKERHQNVTYHDGRARQLRGAAHQTWYINYFNKRYVPVSCHNRKGYATRLIIRKAFEQKESTMRQQEDNNHTKFKSNKHVCSNGQVRCIVIFACMVKWLKL